MRVQCGARRRRRCKKEERIDVMVEGYEIDRWIKDRHREGTLRGHGGSMKSRSRFLSCLT